MNIIEVKVGQLLEVEEPTTLPVITGDDYKARIAELVQLGKTFGLTHLVVYGDREHYSNLYYLTGFDPRFEEALLVLSEGEIPTLIVGNEGLLYAKDIPYDLNVELYQTFSLMGQARDQQPGHLEQLLRQSGLSQEAKVGLIGWKFFTDDEVTDPAHCFEVPHFIVQTLSGIVGPKNIRNANDLMLHPEYGVRITLDVKELVLAEVGGTKASQAMLRVLRALEPGMSELEASRYLCLDGYPLSIHPNVNFGAENVSLWVASPKHNSRLQIGDVMNVAVGYRGGLAARTGVYVRDASELPGHLKDVVDELYKPYFHALCRWYEAIRIGDTGGQVFDEVYQSLGDFGRYGIGLNPGHLIHTDEWTNSIFFRGSKHEIRSGMAIQCDMIASPGEPYVGVHVEDGIIVADEATRKVIQQNYPETWNRVQARRKFMRDVLGINLAEEVLPTSDVAGALFPYLGNLSVVLAQE